MTNERIYITFSVDSGKDTEETKSIMDYYVSYLDSNNIKIHNVDIQGGN